MESTLRHARSFATILFVQIAALVASPASVTFAARIDFFDSAGWAPQALSGDGTTVIGRLPGRGGPEPNEIYRWRADSGVETLGLPVPDGVSSVAVWGTSADGERVVGSFGDYASLRTRSFLHDATTDRTTLLDDLPHSVGQEGDLLTFAGWISDAGDRVLGRARNTEGRSGPILWDETGRLERIDAGAQDVFPVDLSGDGTVVLGAVGAPGENNGVLWAGGAWGRSIGSEFDDDPWALSDDGSTILFQRHFDASGDGRSQILLWDADNGFVPLTGRLESALYIYDLDLSGDGAKVIGEAFFGPEIGRAPFVWDAESGARILADVLLQAGLDVAELEIRSVIDVSDDGRTFLGEAFDPALQRTRSFVATIPEPSAALLLMLGMFGLGRSARASERERLRRVTAGGVSLG